jgi:hypothetical protein
MKRAETIEKLIKEGFSEKTLVKFNDNQLKKFADKILKEAQNVTTTKTVYDSKDPKDIVALNAALKNPDALKNQPAEVKEGADERFVGCSSIGVKSPGMCEKATKKPVVSCAKMGIKTPGYCYADNKKPVSKIQPTADTKPSINLKSINEFVNNVVAKKYHTLTTKSEIIEMVKLKMNKVVSEDLTEKKLSKLPEFLSFDSIVSAGKPEEAPVQPEVIPDTPTREKPRREDDPRKRPFRNPNEEPAADPDPKAKIRKLNRPKMSMAAE